MSLLRPVSGGGHLHWCPGCQGLHHIPATWIFNGDFEHPTFDPSVKLTWNEGEPPVDKVCHYVITWGVIHFCEDSTHALSNKDVPMEPLPESFSC